jgi:hypothetical protein
MCGQGDEGLHLRFTPRAALRNLGAARSISITPSTTGAFTRTAANFAGFFVDSATRATCRRHEDSTAGRTPWRCATYATLARAECDSATACRFCATVHDPRRGLFVAANPPLFSSITLSVCTANAARETYRLPEVGFYSQSVCTPFHGAAGSRAAREELKLLSTVDSARGSDANNKHSNSRCSR